MAGSGNVYDNPAAQAWNTPDNTGSYVGVPDAYKVPVAQTFDPRYLNYPGYSNQQNVYGVPQYHNSEIQALWGKPTAQVLQTQMQLYALGYLPSFVPGTMTQKVADAAEKAFTDANLNGLTLPQMLAKRQQATPALPGASGNPPGSGSGSSSSSTSTSSSTQRSISLTSREAAMSVLSNALSQELGRQPSQDELTRFTNALNRQERANPTVTQQTSTTQSSQSTSGSHTSAHSSTSGTSVSKQGNVDTGYEATQFAKSATLAPERNKFQDSQYMDVIAQMIGAK